MPKTFDFRVEQKKTEFDFKPEKPQFDFRPETVSPEVGTGILDPMSGVNYPLYDELPPAVPDGASFDPSGPPLKTPYPTKRPIVDLGLQEINKAIREMVAPTIPYTREESDRMAGELPKILENIGVNVLTLGGLAGPLMGLKPSELRAALREESEELAGFGPALTPAAGDTALLAVEWGYLYPKLFAAVGATGSQIARIPRVAKGTKALKSLGGLEKVATRYPRTFNTATKSLTAFAKGATVGTIMATPEALGEELPAGEALKHISKRAALLGGISAGFQLASTADTAIYARRLRNALIKASNQRFSAKIGEIQNTITQGPRRSAAFKSLDSLKRIELKNIDGIVSAAESHLMGLKSGKMYQRGQELVETPQKAAERFIKLGYLSKSPYPIGEPSLKKGLGKSEAFIKMPTTRVGEAKEAIIEAMKVVKHPVRAAEKAAARLPKVAAPAVPKEVTPPPMTVGDLQVEKDLAEMDEQAERHLRAIREEAETPPTRGIPAPPEAVAGRKEEIPPVTKQEAWETRYQQWYKKLGERLEKEITGEDILDEMIAEEVNAKEFNDNFWDNVYPELPPEQQHRFEQYAQKLTGFKPGDVIVYHPKTKKETIAKTWADIGKLVVESEQAEHLQGTERGLVVLEAIANQWLQQKPTKVEPTIKRLTEPEAVGVAPEEGQKLTARKGYTYRAIGKAADAVGKDVSMARSTVDWYEGDGFLLEFKGKAGKAIPHHPGAYRGDLAGVEVSCVYYEPGAYAEEFQKDFYLELDKLKNQFPDADFIPIEIIDAEKGLEYRIAKPPTVAKPELTKPPEIPTELTKEPEIAPKVKSIEELQAEIDSYLRAQKNPPTELLAKINAARREQKAAGKPPTPPKPGVTFKEPPRPEGPNVLMLAEVEKRLDEKAMLSEKRKLRPGGRRLAKQFIGKTDLRKMTEEELATFGQIIGKLPEPTYNNKGQRIPPSIPKTTAITKAGEFEREYAEPTFMRIFHAPEYYAEKLGVKSLVEKAEAGKIRFSLEYQQLSNKVDGWVKQIEKLRKTTLSEKAQAKLRNLPTRAVARFRELLDTHDEPPDSLNPREKELFNNFRELTRWLLKRENAVRESLELEPIQYRKAYVRHVAEGMAKEMMAGRYPFPQGRKFWAEEIIAKKIYNTMEMHRTMTEDLEELFSRDLGFATKSMLWTALKEIHLSQPIRYLEQQLTAKGKDTPVYKTLSPSEQAKWDKVATIPSRTRRWVKDYVNVTIKGQQSQLDQDIEAIVKKTGLNGLLNKLLAPFGRALSHKPVSNFVQEAGRAQIMGVLGGPIGGRPRQIMRNKFQTLQGMALYPLYKETWRTYAPIRALRKTTPDLERLLNKSLFLKAYTGTEEWPVDIKNKIAKASLRAYQWSAVTNAHQAMETAYWGMLPLFNKPKFKHYGWADPQRTYEEKPEFLYPSEEKLMLKEMEFGAAATQHNYTPIGMPEVFRHKTLTPITRLQSWWMNHYFRFTEEALRRAFTGKPTYSKKGGPILPWKYRLGWLRYALIAVPILNMMRYQRSYFFGAAPTGVPPFAQFAQGMYNYVVGKGAGSDQQWKRGKKQMIQSGKTFIPGYMSYKDFEAIWSGRKDLESLFFYKKR